MRHFGKMFGVPNATRQSTIALQIGIAGALERDSIINGSKTIPLQRNVGDEDKKDTIHL